MLRLRFISMIFIASILITVLSCTGSPKAPVQPSPAPVSALPGKATWEKEWDKVVAESKKERKVNVWAVAGLWNPARAKMTEAFKNRSGLDVEMVIATSLLLNERLFRERKAGIYDADVILASGAGSIELKKADVLDRIDPALILPEVLDAKAWMGGELLFIDKEHTQLLFGGGVGPYILINTGIAKPEDITSMRDLLNPRWKGKIAMYDPTTPGPGRTQFMVMASNELGMDYLRELLKQEPVITRDPRQHLDWVSKGVYPVLLGFMAGMVQDYQKAGAPIKVVMPPKEAAFYGYFSSILTMPKNAPHPAATKVFANWILSKEGQTLVTGLINTPSRRLDVPNQNLVDPALVPDPSIKYRQIDHPDEIPRHDEYQKKINDVFIPYLRK